MAIPRAVPKAKPALEPRELDLLLKVSRAVALHRERDALLAALAGALDELEPIERLTALVPGEAGPVAHTYAVPGATELGESPEPSEGSALAWVLESREPLIASSLDPIWKRFPETQRVLSESGMRSIAVLPLVVGDRAVGALGFLSRAGDEWAVRRRSLLEEIASSTAAALDNCLACEQLQGMSRELRALVDVSSAIGAHLERDELFGALARCLQDLLPIDRFGIELPLPPDLLQAHLLTAERALQKRTQPHVLPAAGTACDWVLRRRQRLVIDSREQLRERFPVTFGVMQREGVESLCALPLVTADRCRAVVFFMAVEQAAYARLRPELLQSLASAVAVALDDCLAHEAVRRLRDRLAAENVYLREEIRDEHGFNEIVGRSAALRRVLQQVELVAPTDLTVLIQGATGTGKELVARAIHAHSHRAKHPLIKVNCAAIPAGLVESELFGHEKGAFTGAAAQRIGRFELADGGTIFLDEVGELPLEAQVKLLRVLQEREFERVGGSKMLRTDVRVIAATNRDLAAEMEEGRFRQDLYYRLSVFPLLLPPLHERPEDIELLAHHFLQRHARRIGREAPRLTAEALEQLRGYAWPGNVRELENVIERALILSPGAVLELDGALRWRDSVADRMPAMRVAGPDAASGEAADGPTTLLEAERAHLLLALERCGWIIEGPRGAAQQLGLHPNTLRSRMKRLGLKRPA